MSRKMALLCQEEILLQKFYNGKVWPKKYLISEITLGINVASKIEENLRFPHLMLTKSGLKLGAK